MYSFLFDRRSLTLLLSGMAVVGILLFSGGVLVGLRIQLERTGPATIAQFRPLSEGGGVPLTAPASETVPERAEPDRPDARQEAPTLEAPAAETSAPIPAAAPAPAEEDARARAAVFAERTIELAPQAVEASLTAGSAEPRVLPAALTLPSRPAPPVLTPELAAVPVLSHAELLAVDGEPTYAVQVASFQLRVTAASVALELAGNGWETYLVPFATPSGRRMHSVRFGRFTAAEDAYRAAREFERREGATTLVRLQIADG